MRELYEDLSQQMKSRGADLIGAANLAGFHELATGISVAVAIPPDVINSIHDGPTAAYFDAYHRINALLNDIVSFGAEYLTDRGYAACAQTTTAVAQSADYRTALPHKTVASRAGLGWIGKCALLITEAYGSAIRISSLLTDAVLPYGAPIDSSRCARCQNCKDNCPANAITGELWRVESERESLVDVFKCQAKARSLSLERIHENITLCGKCIQICPYTQRYLAGAMAGE